MDPISERLSFQKRSFSGSDAIKSPKSLTHAKSSLATPRTSLGLSSLAGDGSYITRGPGARESDGLLSLPSPTQSRSSSARDSYSTTATNYDDTTQPGRTIQDESHDVEAKGNVLVSVRARPDASERMAVNGDWHIDSKQSLVSYTGKESGDYFYGILHTLLLASITDMSR